MSLRIIYSALILLCTGYAHAGSNPFAAEQKTYYYKKLDQVITENRYRDTGFKKAVSVNDSIIVISHSEDGIYLVDYFGSRKIVYVEGDTVNLNLEQSEPVNELSKLVTGQLKDVTIASIQALWQKLSALDNIDPDYYKSMLTDLLLNHQPDAITAVPVTELLSIVYDQTKALGDFEYTPNMCTKWPLYTAHRVDKTILRSIKAWHGDEVSRIFDLNEQYSDWRNMTADSIEKIQHELDVLKVKFPTISKAHSYLFEVPDKIDFPMFVNDTTLTKIDITNRLAGKYTIMYFWGTWCAPCLRIAKDVLPLIQEQISGNDSLQIITVAAESSSRTAMWQEDVSKNKRGLYNAVAISEMDNGWSGPATPQVLQLLEIFSLPNFFVIGPDKKIILRNDINGKETMKIVDRINGNNPPGDSYR
ncbi:MAG: TlpA family protein disulfide reductase [Chitinophagaceae bacterium]|nr:TlpA family protein disulfide reductase [Chitinophagaceae bacterium]MCB9046838.1 TlpA family protein disulfide reductase [Chitinophagales bacterium]